MRNIPREPHDHNATPLSSNGCTLDEMFIRDGSEQERHRLIVGHTFGSAIAERRREQRMRVQDLLTAIDGAGHLNVDVWNEVEQDRLDPASLGDDVLHALARTLGLSFDELEALVAKHYMARQEERKLWSMLTEEAHAFRRRKNVV